MYSARLLLGYLPHKEKTVVYKQYICLMLRARKPEKIKTLESWNGSDNVQKTRYIVRANSNSMGSHFHEMY